MKWMGYGKNPAGSNPLLVAIGKFIVNFGALEAATYFWLVQLQGSFPLQDGDVKARFLVRVNHITELAETKHVPRLEDIRAKWATALELARFRNRLAHNPIMFGWSGVEQTGEPDSIRIIDFQTGLASGTAGDPSIALPQLNSLVNEVAELAESLQELYRQMWPTAGGTAG